MFLIRAAKLVIIFDLTKFSFQGKIFFSSATKNT